METFSWHKGSDHKQREAVIWDYRDCCESTAGARTTGGGQTTCGRCSSVHAHRYPSIMQEVNACKFYVQRNIMLQKRHVDMRQQGLMHCYELVHTYCMPCAMCSGLASRLPAGDILLIVVTASQRLCMRWWPTLPKRPKSLRSSCWQLRAGLAGVMCDNVWMGYGNRGSVAISSLQHLSGQMESVTSMLVGLPQS